MTTFIHDTWSEEWVSLDDRPLLDPEVIAQLWRCYNTKRGTMQQFKVVPWSFPYPLFGGSSGFFPDGTNPEHVRTKRNRRYGGEEFKRLWLYLLSKEVNSLMRQIIIDDEYYMWATGDEDSYEIVSFPTYLDKYEFYYTSPELWRTMVEQARTFFDSLDMLATVEGITVKVSTSRALRYCIPSYHNPGFEEPDEYIGTRDIEIELTGYNEGWVTFTTPHYYHDESSKLYDSGYCSYDWGDAVDLGTNVYYITSTIGASTGGGFSETQIDYPSMYGLWYNHRCYELWSAGGTVYYLLSTQLSGKRRIFENNGLTYQFQLKGNNYGIMLYTTSITIEAIDWPAGLTLNVMYDGNKVGTLSTGGTITVTPDQPSTDTTSKDCNDLVFLNDDAIDAYNRIGATCRIGEDEFPDGMDLWHYVNYPATETHPSGYYERMYKGGCYRKGYIGQDINGNNVFITAPQGQLSCDAPETIIETKGISLIP